MIYKKYATANITLNARANLTQFVSLQFHFIKSPPDIILVVWHIPVKRKLLLNQLLLVILAIKAGHPVS